MEYICIGKIVNTHGIKGELRLLSDFDRKELVFKENFNIYIGENYQKEIIKSYRHHKSFDMITLIGYSNINEVLKYKDLKVYVNRDDLNLNNNDYVLEDLIGLSIIDNNTKLGEVIDYINNDNNILLVVEGEKKFYIPKVDEYIVNVDLNKKEITTKNVNSLIL